MPYVDHARGRAPDVARHGLGLIRELIGDHEPDVQKALAWAVRSLAQVDRDGTAAFLAEQAEIAATTADGQRAWVIRDALSRLDPAAVTETL